MARSTRANTPLAPEQPTRRQPKRGASSEPEPKPATVGTTKSGKGKRGRPKALDPIPEKSPSPKASGPSPKAGSDNRDAKDNGDLDEPQVNLEDLSPTLSTGPEFKAAVRPDPEAIKAAVKTVYHPDPRGFKNKNGTQCYRNALIVTLLSSSKLMSWIEHRYIPNLQAGGVTIDSVVAKKGSKAGKKPQRVLYTDFWCELNALHTVWCDSSLDQKDLDKAMDVLWKWLQKEDSSGVVTNRWAPRFKGHQDAIEFLAWCVELATQQLERFVQLQAQGVSGSNVPPLDPIQRSLLESVSINEIIGFEHTTRGLCVVCGGLREGEDARSKYRVERPDADWRWIVSLGESADDGQPAAKSSDPRKIEDLIQGEMKALANGQRCSVCYSEWEAMKDKRLAKAEKRGGKEERRKEYKRIMAELEPILARKSTQWRRFQVLPEVLIIQLKRFKSEMLRTSTGTGMVTSKNDTPVAFDEYLDLKSFIEHRVEEEVAVSGSTRYRLTGIINHYGILDVGHYIADVRIDDTWHELNDARVKPEADLQAFLQNQRWGPYVLLYERCAIGDDAGADIVGSGEKDDDASANANANVNVTVTATGKGDGGDDDGDGDDSDDADDDNKGSRNDNKPTGKGKGKEKDHKHDSPDRAAAAVPPQSPLLPVVQGFGQSRAFGIQIAQDALQKGQISLKVRATINGCVIHFPTYVLSGCGMEHGQNGRQTAEVDMVLRDHEDAEAQIMGRALLTLVPTRAEAGGRDGIVEPAKSSSTSKKRKRQGNGEPVKSSPGKKRKGNEAKPSPNSQKGKRGSGSSGGKSPRSSPRTRASPRSPIEPPSSDNWKTKPIDGPGLDYEPTPRNLRGKSKDSDFASLFGSP
ncbi:ubiquitin-specific protease ubp2 [Knufia peltigerae]|uniref:Ubiquitin-specific protease ubp2 n=1 Tax=Knufia peltigerae TaxID=1002370 RepID=A0AA38Y1U9_9EURO|nr:ubiquitin-specific protease ubp2 [Knufia peltigerae]